MTVLEQVSYNISNYMLRIGHMFVEGCTVTIIVRHPTDHEADFIMTNDRLVEIHALVQRRIDAGTEQTSPVFKAREREIY